MYSLSIFSSTFSGGSRGGGSRGSLEPHTQIPFLNIVLWLFVVVLRVCLQFVIVAFPDQTHLLFKYSMNMK